MFILSYTVIKKLVKVINKVKHQLEAVADGDLTYSIDDKIANRQDELGQMVDHTNTAVSSF